MDVRSIVALFISSSQKNSPRRQNMLTNQQHVHIAIQCTIEKLPLEMNFTFATTSYIAIIDILSGSNNEELSVMVTPDISDDMATTSKFEMCNINFLN